jgi:hypothetical protein
VTVAATTKAPVEGMIVKKRILPPSMNPSIPLLPSKFEQPIGRWVAYAKPNAEPLDREIAPCQEEMREPGA